MACCAVSGVCSCRRRGRRRDQAGPVPPGGWPHLPSSLKEPDALRLLSEGRFAREWRLAGGGSVVGGSIRTVSTRRQATGADVSHKERLAVA